MLAANEKNPRSLRVGRDVPARRKPMQENYPVGPEIRPYQFLIQALVFVVPAVDQRSKKLVPLFVAAPGYR